MAINPRLQFGSSPELYDIRRDGFGIENLCSPDAWNDIGNRLVHIQKYVRPENTNFGLASGFLTAGSSENPITYAAFKAGCTAAPSVVTVYSTGEKLVNVPGGTLSYFPVKFDVPKNIWSGSPNGYTFFVRGIQNGSLTDPGYFYDGTWRYVYVTLACAGVSEKSPDMRTWHFWLWHAYNPAQRLLPSDPSVTMDLVFFALELTFSSNTIF